MTELPASPFLPDGRTQFAWDSVTISAAMDCPRKYQYQVILGYESKSPAVAIELAFGILVHKGVEWYHRLRADGMFHDDASRQAIHFLTNMPEYRQLPTEEQFQQRKEQERTAADELDEDADEGSLRNARLRTRYFLWRALVWYFEHYKHDPLRVIQLVDGRTAVELSCRVPLGFSLSDGTEVLLCGHLDKVVDFNGQLYVSDIKTTKSITQSWRRDFDLSHQMSGYTFLGNAALSEPIAGVVIDGISLQVGGVKFARHFTRRLPSQMGEYMHNLQLLTREYEQYAQLNYYPMRTTSCWRCRYKDICSQPPEMRQGHLNHLFRPNRGWNPLEPR